MGKWITIPVVEKFRVKNRLLSCEIVHGHIHTPGTVVILYL